MRHLTIIPVLLLALMLIAPYRTSAVTTTPTPTPSEHTALGTPTAIPAPVPSLSAVWVRPGRAHAAWGGVACLHRYSAAGTHTFVGCRADSLDTPADAGDTFAIVVGMGVSAHVHVYGAALLPIVR